MSKSSSCLKIFLVGCAFLMVATIVIVLAGGYIAQKWFGDLIGTKESSFGRRITDLNTRYSYTPRKDGIITEGQLKRLLNIGKSCSGMLNSVEMKKEIQRFENSTNPSIDGFRFWMKFGNSWRETLVSTLEQNQMSLEEYHYIHRNALKSWAALYRKQAHEIVEKQKLSGTSPAPVPEIPDEVMKALDNLADVPESNLLLIEKHKEEVEKYLGTAPFAKLLFPLLVETEKDSFF